MHKIKDKRVKHGMKNTQEYKIWIGINTRCNNKNSNTYKNYGGRGIKRCDRWNDFSNFYKDMGKRPSKNHSIERIDNDGDYCPENCVWSDRYFQSRNKRSNRIFEHEGKSMCLKDWSKIKSINYQTLVSRINKLGWSFEKAISR